MNRRALLRFLPLALGVYLVLAVGLHVFGHWYYDVLLEGVKVEVGLITDEYEPLILSARHENQRHIVYSQVTRTTSVTDRQGRVYPWLTFENRIMLDGFYVFHLLILPLVLAWPYGDLRRRALGAGLGIFLAGTATMADSAFLLLGEWDGRLGLDTWVRAAQADYLHYMEALGGRQLLAVLLAGAAIALACRIFPQKHV